MQFSSDHAKQTVNLARLAYLQPAEIESELTSEGLGDIVHFDAASTQAFVASGDGITYASFRGSQEPADWLKNARFLPSTNEMGATVHTGFVEALDEVWGEFEPAISASGSPVMVTGHSLGAALASLAALRLAMGGGEVAAVYTYGQPRTGHGSFRDLYEPAIGAVTYRFVNHIDLVTRVPLLLQGYRHVGRRMYFDASGSFHPEASAWRVAADDLRYRLIHFGQIGSVGIDDHLIGQYQNRVDSL